MKAQQLYDLREQFEFCSGSDLHEFFHEQTGQMSPAGSVELPDKAAAVDFVGRCADAIVHNCNGGFATEMEECKKTARAM